MPKVMSESSDGTPVGEPNTTEGLQRSVDTCVARKALQTRVWSREWTALDGSGKSAQMVCKDTYFSIGDVNHHPGEEDRFHFVSAQVIVV